MRCKPSFSIEVQPANASSGIRTADAQENADSRRAQTSPQAMPSQAAAQFPVRPTIRGYLCIRGSPLRPPRTHFLDGMEDAFRRLGRFVASQGEDEEGMRIGSRGLGWIFSAGMKSASDNT